MDPDGEKIIYAKGSTPSFKQSVQTAVNYLYKCGASKIVNELIKNPNIIITIKEETRDICGSYNGNDNVLKWNPKLGCMTDEGIIVSPTTILNHEFDHALQENTKHEQYKNDQKINDNEYKNKEECRVIKGSEQQTAKSLGEIKDNEVTRKNHNGEPVMTKSVTSNKLWSEYE